MDARSLIALGLSLALSASPALAERVSRLDPAGASADGQRRSALVIGNSAYTSSPLRNPVNDARAMGRMLADTGFKVTVLEDATQGGMRRAIREFGSQIAGGGVGLFYYAGHGMQVRGKNYLIPVNADIQAEDEVIDQAIDANFVLGKMDSANNGLNIVILDACRNNPFHRSFRSAAQGLAQMDAPSGTLIAFATAPGSVAADGDGDNGLYTKHLLEQIRNPGMPVEQLFKQVRVGVTKDTRDRQIPWESSSLRGDFYFTAPQKAAGSSNEASLRQALKESEVKAAREREAMQANMQKMIQEALERQKKMLEAESAQRAARTSASVAAPTPTAPTPPAASAPTPPGASAPVQLASAAPSAAAAAGSAGPGGLQVGDRWEYEVFDRIYPEKGKKRYVVEVAGFSDQSVLELTVAPGGHRREWVHQPGVYLVGGSSPIPLPSPYMLGVALEGAEREWQNVALQSLSGCTTESGRPCEYESASMALVGTERIRVEGTELDAIKLRIDVQVACDNCRGTRVSYREATFWYAPSLKRVVKGSWEDLEMNLVSHRVAGAN